MALDLVGGVTLLAIAALFRLRAGAGTLDWLFPIVLSYALAAVGVYLVVRGALGRGARVPVVPPLLRGKGIDVAVFALLAVCYVALARPVGFWLMSVVTILLGSVYMDTSRSRRSTAVSVAVALGVTGVGFLLMTRVFYVPLPEAPWLPL